MLNDQDILNRASSLVQQATVGMFTTIDLAGVPRSRFMVATTLADGLHLIYSLTTSHSRKVEQIHNNPNVCWLFSSASDRSLVMLMGTARLLTSPMATPALWDRLIDLSQTQYMDILARQRSGEYRVIETQVHTLEFVSPELDIVEPRVIQFAEPLANLG